jgi:hypothetical protein
VVSELVFLLTCVLHVLFMTPGEEDYIIYRRWRQYTNQCSKCRLRESIGDGPECNFSVTSTKYIGTSRKISEDLKKIQNTHFFQFFKYRKQQQH